MQSMQSVQEALSSRRSGLAQCILFLVKYAKYARVQEASSSRRNEFNGAYVILSFRKVCRVVIRKPGARNTGH